MATMLAIYLQKQEEINHNITVQQCPPEGMLVLQELKYRIGVLETFQAYLKTAPITTDVRQLQFHYQLMRAYIGFLETERKFGVATDDEGKKKRRTAAETLIRVIEDHKKRFGSFRATSPEQYKKEIGNLVNTVLPVWIQYRNTYVQI